MRRSGEGTGRDAVNQRTFLGFASSPHLLIPSSPYSFPSLPSRSPILLESLGPLSPVALTTPS